MSGVVGLAALFIYREKRQSGREADPPGEQPD